MGVWYGAAGAVGGGLVGALSTVAMGYVASRRKPKSPETIGQDDLPRDAEHDSVAASFAAEILARAAEEHQNEQKTSQGGDSLAVDKVPHAGNLDMTGVMLASGALLGVIFVSNVRDSSFIDLPILSFACGGTRQGHRRNQRVTDLDCPYLSVRFGRFNFCGAFEAVGRVKLGTGALRTG